MNNYIIRPYQPGFDAHQAQIGINVALNWVWPFAYDQDDLLKIQSQPDFDPETHLYCFLGDEMVGYLSLSPITIPDTRLSTVRLDFPRMKPGHEQAAPLLIENTLERINKKGIHRVLGRVSTMNPNEIIWAEQAGFKIYDWGYKVYYQYNLSQGKLTPPQDMVENIHPDRDLQEVAKLASLWYKQPVDWCLRQLEDWHQYGIITHNGIRSLGRWVAACLTARNVLRHETAANYYIYTPDEESLSYLLTSAINQCCDQGIFDLVADLINEHRLFEPVYLKLGFKKVAEWARCELDLTVD